jgi:hypothetical protein
MTSKWDKYIVDEDSSKAASVADKWSKYVVNEEKNPEISSKSEEIAKGFKFFGYQPNPETIEDIRQPVGVALKGFAEGLVGTPGNIYEVGKSVFGLPQAKNPLPTSQDVGSFFEKASGEKFQPQNLPEEILGETAGALGSILGLGGPLKGPTLAKSLQRTGLAAFIPATTSVLAGKAALPPWAQASAVIGSGLLTHRITGKSLNQIEKDLYTQSGNMSKGVVIPSNALNSRIEKLGSEMAQGLSTGPKTRIRSMMNEISAKASGGAIPLDDLIQFRKDVIEVSKEFTPEIRKGSARYWSGLRSAIDASIGDYEKLNPEFSQVYRQANSIHRGLNEARYVERFIKNHKTASGFSTAGAEGFLKILGYSLGTIPTITTAGATKMAEFTAAMVRNPGLRKAWKDILKDASKNEVKAVGNSLKVFEKYAKDEDLIEND